MGDVLDMTLDIPTVFLHRQNVVTFELAHVQITYVKGSKISIKLYAKVTRLQFLTYSRNSPHFMEPEGSHHVHNSPQLSHILSQITPFHVFPPYFFKIPFNIILPSTPRSSKWSVSFRFLKNQNPVCTPHLPHTWHTPYYLFSLDVISQEISVKKHKS